MGEGCLAEIVLRKGGPVEDMKIKFPKIHIDVFLIFVASRKNPFYFPLFWCPTKSSIAVFRPAPVFLVVWFANFVLIAFQV